ncbi:unnamed protein product [Paramecium sonneborni]|uniref:RING-type domain-containing protein n=1 Tax=Paramecium sonneborni TaxID=65129 RepID=A0A8S1KW72_9CILI|nr:unnamed protein product [Paramecium sonneborni]
MRRDLNNSQSQQTTENIQQLETLFRYEQAHELLTQAILSNSVYAIAVLLLGFELAYDGNLLCVIYCIHSKLFLQILHQIYFYRIFANKNIKYNHTFIRLLQIFFEECFVLALNFYAINRDNELILFSNIFPVINIFLSLIVKINEGNQFFKESVQQINLFYVFRNICILLTSTFLCLKIEGYFDIQWLYTLWIFWLLFSLLASIALYYIFVVLALCIQVILEQCNRQKCLVITNIWILLFLISCSSMLFMIPMSILNNIFQGTYYRAIEVDRIILIVNQIIFTYFSFKFKPELISSLQIFLSLNDSINPLHSVATQQADVQLQQFKQNFIESQNSEAQMQIPKVVKRISKTYFGFDDLNSEKKSDLKNQDQNKKPTHHKALSSQIQKTIENFNDKIKLASMVNFKIIEKEDLDELKGTSILQDKQKQNEPKSISLSSINSCCICYDNDSDALFMPCGHSGVCYHCALDLWKNKDECYLCRKKVERVLQIQICKNEKDIYQVVCATELNQKLKKRPKINQQQHDQ